MADYNDVDLNDLSMLFDEDLDADPDKGKQKKKKKSKIPLILTLVVLLGGGFLFVKGMNNAPEEQSQQAQPPESIQVELVNLQQVAWADNMCQLISSYDAKKKELKPKGTPTPPVKIRTIMVKNINSNRERIKEISSDINKLPEKSLEQAHTMGSQTTPVDNNLQVSSGIDPKVGEMNREISSAYQGYDSALEKVTGNLNAIADYNSNGIRDGIDAAKSELDNLNKQLGEGISKTINEDSFDNLATLEAISNLESCNGSVVNGEELKKEKSEELEFMHRVTDITVRTRCTQFMDGTVGSTDDTTKKWRELCNDALTSIVVNDTDPLTKSQLDMQEDNRIIPNADESQKSSATPPDTEKKKSSSSSTSTPTSAKKN